MNDLFETSGTSPTPETCLTCGQTIPVNPINGWAGGNNPWPLNDEPSLADRRVCDECNGLYVIPARLGHEVSGTLYDEHGEELGTFGVVRVGGAA